MTPINAFLIQDRPHSAAFNMAADQYLLSTCEQRPSLFIRLYSWEKPSITLGLSEKASTTLDIPACQHYGVDWIRRPTGGRSVLHYNDITYSCLFSSSLSGMGTKLMETYSLISECLMRGLACASVQCEPHDSAIDSALARSAAKLPCFLSPNRHEIMVNGKKLVGSAQKRTSRAVLQHGSIPLLTDFRLLPDYLLLSTDERTTQKQLLTDKTICIKEILPDFNEAHIRQCIVNGFRETLPFTFTNMEWSEKDISEIERMSGSKEFIDRWQSDN